MKRTGSKKHKIVYIPSRYYLSNAVYYPIAKCESAFEDIYFNTKEVRLTTDAPYTSVDREEVLNYFDSYLEIEGSFLTKILNAKSQLARFRAYRAYASEIERVLSSISPSCLVSNHDVYEISVRICNQWARKNKIPFIVLQAGPIKFQPKLSLSNFRARLKRRLINKIWGVPVFNKQEFWGQECKTNYVFVWGEYFKETYAALNKDVSRFYVIGNPLFDEYQYDSKEKRLRRENFFNKNKINIDRSSKVILFCTQPLTTAYERFGAQDYNHIYGMMKEAILDNKDKFFIIKVHPREEMSRYVSFLSDLNQPNFIITQKDDINELLIAADIQISAYSTTSLQALIYGTPVILVRTENIDDYYSESEMFDTDAMTKAKTINELNELIVKAYTTEFIKEFEGKRLQFIQKTIYALDGKSAERFYEKVEDILLSHSN